MSEHAPYCPTPPDRSLLRLTSYALFRRARAHLFSPMWAEPRMSSVPPEGTCAASSPAARAHRGDRHSQHRDPHSEAQFPPRLCSPLIPARTTPTWAAFLLSFLSLRVYAVIVMFRGLPVLRAVLIVHCTVSPMTTVHLPLSLLRCVTFAAPSQRQIRVPFVAYTSRGDEVETSPVPLWLPRNSESLDDKSLTDVSLRTFTSTVIMGIALSTPLLVLMTRRAHLLGLLAHLPPDLVPSLRIFHKSQRLQATSKMNSRSR
jgi:hypothetical protein